MHLRLQSERAEEKERKSRTARSCSLNTLQTPDRKVVSLKLALITYTLLERKHGETQMARLLCEKGGTIDQFCIYTLLLSYKVQNGIKSVVWRPYCLTLQGAWGH